MRQKVFRTLDGLRGIAALLIVMRHTENFFAPIAFKESYLAVDLFFVMSGVVLCHSYEQKLLHGLSPWRFAWLRIVRIYPLYLLGCAIAVPALLLTPDSLISTHNLVQVMLLGLFLFPNVFPGGGGNLYPLDAPSWSLFFELSVNFFYGFFCIRLNDRITAVIVAVSGAALLPIILFSRHHNLNLGFTLKSFPSGIFRVAFSFFIGVLICRWYTRRPKVIGGLAGNVASWAVATLVAVLLVLPIADRLQSAYDFTVVIAVFPVIVAVSLAFEMSGASAVIFKFLGVISYAVYVLHAPLARLIEAVLPKHGAEIVPFAPLAGLAFLAVLIVVCYLVDLIYDIPIRRRLTTRTTHPP